MATERCPQCGRDYAAETNACAECSRSVNGIVPPETLPSGKLPPELMEWARREFNEEEFLAGAREIQETGGIELKDFIQELEQEAARRD